MKPKSGKSKRSIIPLAVLVCVLLLFAVAQQAFNLSPIFSDPESQTTLFLWAFTSLNVILLLTLILILLRHLLKLYFEQKNQRPGSRFHRKLLFSFLGVALVPGVFMYFFAYAVVNRNLDKWFSSPLDQAFEPVGIGELAQQVERDASQRAVSTARFLVRHPDIQSLWNASGPEGIQELERIALQLEIPFAVVLDRAGDPLLAYRNGQTYLPTDSRFSEMVRPLEVVAKNLSGQELYEALNNQVWTVSWKEGSPGNPQEQPLLLTGTQSESGGLIVGSRPPVKMASFARELSSLSQEYEQMKERRKMIRTNFMLVLGVVTLLVLFPAVWIALFLSRKITEPIRALAEASNEVSQGNLSIQVNSPAPDELGILVSSFNRMTTQLNEAARDLAAKNRDLEESHRTSEARRRYTEAVLENIPTGVISIAADTSINTMNEAAQQMLQRTEDTSLFLAELFQPQDLAEIQGLMVKAGRVSIASKELELKTQRGTFYGTVTLSSLDPADVGPQRFVMVLEDLAELLRAQKANAWREVARRMAHEIKNPLTPIQLSADRILKQLSRTKASEDRADAHSLASLGFQDTLKECVYTITQEVKTLKGMVDEFSRFAQLPSPTMVPSSLNAIIENTLASYDSRLDGIEVVTQLGADLPLTRVDPEQFKRVLVNLIDNALEAMDQSDSKELSISSLFSPSRETIQLTVRDNGQGIAAGDHDKLFLPYFSTRKRGTGLGLAIANRIIADHKGYIHVEDNSPRGTSFVIELPALEPSETSTEPPLEKGAAGPGAGDRPELPYVKSR